MRLRTLFIVNAVIAVGYAGAFLMAAGPLLAIYGIAPSTEATFMARWFGVGLLAIGLVTWLAREAAASAAGRAIMLALAITYSVGVLLALWGTIAGPFNWTGWIAVGFNALLALGFGYSRFRSAPERPAM